MVRSRRKYSTIFCRKTIEFPELVVERPATVLLTPDEVFQMFQNKTRDPQDPNESWISAYIQYLPIDWISEELKEEISEPGFEKDFFTQLKLKETFIWIGKSQLRIQHQKFIFGKSSRES